MIITQNERYVYCLEEFLRDFATQKGYFLRYEYDRNPESREVSNISFLFHKNDEAFRIDVRLLEIKNIYDTITNVINAVEEHFNWRFPSESSLFVMPGRRNGKTAMLNDYKSMYGRYCIDKVIFNAPATIVFWKDGTKTVVKCQGDDEFDPEKGLAMAISKKVLGNKYDYFNTFKHWTKKYEKDCEKAIMTFEEFKKALEDLNNKFN